MFMLKKSNYEFSLLRSWPIVFLACMVLLLFYLSVFNFPSSDDYSFYEMVEKNGVFESLKILYRSWSGRMVSFFVLFALNPLKDSDYVAYRILALPLIPAFIHAVYMALKYVFWPEQSSRLYMLMLLFILLYLPNTADWFFWFITSYSYTLGFVLLMYWIVLMHQFIIESKNTTFYSFLVIILPVLITGCCELSLFGYLVGIVVFISISPKNFISNRVFIASSITGILSAMIWLLAPGSQVRSETFIELYQAENHSVTFTFIETSKSLFKWCVEWCVKSPLIFLLILLCSEIKASKSENPAKAIYQIGLGVGTIALLFAAYFWATGISFSPLRLANYGFMAFCLIILPGFVRLVYPWFKRYTNQKKWLTPLSVFLLFVFIGFRSNFKHMIIDSINSFNHKKEMSERFGILKANQGKDVKIPLVKHPLRTTFFADIDSSSNHWYNRSLAEYYGVKSIVPEN